MHHTSINLQRFLVREGTSESHFNLHIASSKDIFEEIYPDTIVTDFQETPSAIQTPWQDTSGNFLPIPMPVEFR